MDSPGQRPDDPRVCPECGATCRLVNMGAGSDGGTMVGAVCPDHGLQTVYGPVEGTALPAEPAQAFPCDPWTDRRERLTLIAVRPGSNCAAAPAADCFGSTRTGRCVG